MGTPLAAGWEWASWVYSQWTGHCCYLKKQQQVEVKDCGKQSNS